MTHRAALYVEIEKERAHQDERFGTQTDDTLNTPWMWVGYIAGYASKWMIGSFLPLGKDTTDAFRKCMIKTAALCLAAVESLDRQREANGGAFYE